MINFSTIISQLSANGKIIALAHRLNRQQNRLAGWLALLLFGFALLIGAPSSTFAGAVRAGFNSYNLPANDDGSTAKVGFGFAQPINYLGISATGAFINNNGNLTFNSALSTYTPFPITTTNTAIIAPFFGDVDTRGTGSGHLTYGPGTVNGRPAFGASWVGVGYYSQRTDRLNSFQLVLIDRSDTGTGNFDMEFNYDQIQWEAGDASGGSNGLGGTPARAGYANGTGRFYELNGSGGTGALLDSNLTTGLIYRSLNSPQLGRYIFPVRGGIIGTLPPVASAGQNQDAVYGEVVGLDASATYDPQSLPLTYLWTQTAGTAVVLSDSTAIAPTFPAPTSPGQLSFQVVASNSQLSGTASVNINVANVATLPISSGSGVNVTFNGMANPGGTASNGWFEWGTTTAYGTSTSQQPLGSGADPVSFSALSRNLVAHTTYHYHAVLLQSGSTFYGSDRVFTASTLPIILSGSASSITYSSATAGVSVNPNGSATTTSFEYGTDITYSSGTISAGSAGNGTSPVYVTTNLTNLTFSTVYHYRMLAANTSGTSYGSDLSFTTAPPPVIASASVSGTTVNSATVSTAIYPDGLDTSVYVRYGTSSSYGNNTTAVAAGSGTSGVPEVITVPGLLPSTTYHLQVVAIQTDGTGNHTVYYYPAQGSPDITFRTPAPIAPPTVSSPSVTGLTATSATLSATMNPAGLNTQCVFISGTDTVYTSSFGPINVSAGWSDSTQSGVFSGLQPNTTYHWEFIASNTTGTASTGDQTFTTLPAPTVSSLSSDTPSYTGVNLSGTVNPNGFDTVVYFQYGTDTSYGSVTEPVDSGSGNLPVPVGAALAGLQPGTAYHWQLVAANTSGTTVGDDQVFTTGAPAPIFSGTLIAISSTNAAFSATVNPNGIPTYVQFDYGLDAGVTTWTTPQLISGTDSVILSDTTEALSPAQTYYYRVTTVSPAGTFHSDPQTFSTLPAPVISGTSVALTARSAAILEVVNPNGVATSAYVQYATGTSPYHASSPLQYLGDSNGFITGTATLSPLNPNTFYHYRIVTTGTAGTYYGNDQTFLTMPAPIIAGGTSVAITATSAVILETVNAAGVPTSLSIAYGSGTGSYSAASAPQSIGNRNALITGTTPIGPLLSGTTYHYQIVTTSAAGTFTGSDLTFVTLPAPDIFGVVATVTGSGVVVSGTVNPHGVGASVHIDLGFDSRYGTSSAGQPLGNGTAAVTASTPLGSLVSGTTYHYRLVTTGSAGTFDSGDRTFATLLPPAGPVLVVSSTGATLNTVLDGSATGCLFQYGPTTDYGFATPWQTLVSGSSSIPVSFPVTGLPPATLYHYQVVVAIGSGLDYGPDQTFVTPRVNSELIAATGDNAPGLGGPRFSTFGGPAIGNSGWVSFRAILGGSGVLPATSTGLWLDSGTASVPLIRTGSAAPGVTGAVFASLGDIALSGSNGAAFYGTLSGRGILTTNNSGIWTNTSGALAKVARTGDAAPGCPAGATFASFSKLTLPSQGGPIFLANLTVGRGGVTTLNNQGIWAVNTLRQLKLLVRKGVPVRIGTLTKTIKTLSAFTTLTGQGRQFSDLGTVICTATHTDGTQCLLKASKLGVLTALEWNNGVTPGIKYGKFVSFGNPVINNSDRAAFKATAIGTGITAANNTGIWADAGLGPVLVVRTGSAAVGVAGGIFASLGDPVSNVGGRIAFSAVLKNGIAGLWTNTSGTLALVARTQGQAPDCATGTVFSLFRRFALPDQGGAVFLADLAVGTGDATASNNQGVWAADNAGQLHLVVRKGDQLMVDGSAKTVLALSAFTSTLEAAGQPGATNSVGDVVYGAAFTDGTQAIFAVVFR